MKYIIGYLVCFISYALYSQGPLYNRSIHYEVQDGLPQNTISGIVQDNNGFIWVSTMDGLARFDGHKFLTFRLQQDDSSSLAFNQIKFFQKDANGNFWLASHWGDIDIFNPISFEITHFKPELSHLDTKLLHFSLLRDCHRQITFDTSIQLAQELSTEEKLIRSFCEDPSGRLWVLSPTQLRVYESTWRNFESFPFPAYFQIEASEYENARLFCLQDGRMVIIINPGRLIIYNPKDGSIKTIEPPTSNKKANAYFGDITQDEAGRLVFDHRKNIYRLNHDDSITLLFNYDSGPGIRNILIDRTNTLWIATDSDGLYSINMLTPRFDSKIYKRDFISDILIQELKINVPTHEKSYINSQIAYWQRYAYDHDHRLFLFLGGENNDGRIAHVSENSLTPFFFNAPIGGSIAIGPDNAIYFMDGAGSLYRWQDLNHSPTVSTLDVARISMQTMAIDANNIWLSNATEGVLQFELTTHNLLRAIKPYGNYNSNVIKNDLLNDSILWIGTIGGGLYKWDKFQNTLRASYQTEDGLPNNTINTIVFDSLGNLWMSTNFGISRFNPTSETFTNYTVDDGLIESEFNRHHEMLLLDGRIAMGGAKGYSVFNPNIYKEDNYNPQVLITGVSMKGKWLNHRIDSLILPTQATQLMNMSLAYTNNSIGFEISSNEFNAPHKIKYRYKLEGSDDQWIINEESHTIYFNNLPYGNYKLMLNASNTDGRWSDQIREVQIVIHPPFWLTWWAYLSYTVIVAVVIRTYWQRYKKRLKEKQEAEFNNREAARLREVDEMKTRFFSNITHEFRTPLTLILSPLEKYLNDGTLPPKALTLLNNNYRHASQLLKLVNQLLDIAKLEAGQMPVHATAGELSVFAESCIAAFKNQATEKNIQLSLTLSQISGHYLFDHDKYEKIIFNLLSNALKFTPEGGHVILVLTDLQIIRNKTTYIEIKVEDSGIGIDKEKLPSIFERFYQADDSATRHHEGTGIGLALVKELVDLLDGNIEVKSKPGMGTQFKIELPAEKLKDTPERKSIETINDFKLSSEQSVSGVNHEVPHILVVEDNDELRSFIIESLQTNWTVFQASNGLEAWSVIENELPEIVVSDVMMPGMNGFELCKRCKQDERTNHINFILLTAKAAQEAKIEGLEAGADDYLTKPFHIYELELRIRNLLVEQDNLRKHLQQSLQTNISSSAEPVKNIFLNKLNQYLIRNLDNTELSAEMIADAMSMSHRSLNRKVGALAGYSIIEYVRRFRLQQSIQYLDMGLTVSEVSTRVGFETSRYFSQCFKEHFHQTPSEYLKSSTLS